MLTEREWQGKWWLPDLPDKPFDGTATYTPESGLRLTIKGFLPNIFRKNKKEFYEVILGNAERGVKITLLNCTFSHNAIIGLFSPRYLIEGIHFSSGKEALLHRVSVSFNSLTNWAGVTGFGNSEDETEGHFVIRYKKHPGKTIYNKDKLKFVLRSKLSFSANRGHTFREIVEEETIMSIESRRKYHIEKFFDAIFSLVKFLSLAIGGAAHPRKISGLIGIYAKKYNNKTSVEIFPSLAVAPTDEKPIYISEMPFPFYKLQSRSQEILSKWIQTQTKYQRLLGVYVSTISTKNMYTDRRFIAYLNILEGLFNVKHRRNRRNFKHKIVSLLSENCEVLDKMHTSPEDFFDLPKLINTRNYYTHYDPRLESNILRGEDFYRTIERLKILFEICIWRELGLDANDISGAYNALPILIQHMGLPAR